MLAMWIVRHVDGRHTQAGAILHVWQPGANNPRSRCAWWTQCVRVLVRGSVCARRRAGRDVTCLCFQTTTSARRTPAAARWARAPISSRASRARVRSERRTPSRPTAGPRARVSSALCRGLGRGGALFDGHEWPCSINACGSPSEPKWLTSLPGRLAARVNRTRPLRRLGGVRGGPNFNFEEKYCGEQKVFL